MVDYDLGKVTGDKGADGAAIWTTSTAPTYANSKYTFTISNLTGRSGLTIAVSDLIFYDAYYYIVSAVNSTTVDCTTRVSIKGSDASVTIVDNLTSDSTTSALSAKQGKVLNTNKADSTHTHGNLQSDGKIKISGTAQASKNVVTDSSGNITAEAKPTIPTKTSDLQNDGADGTNVFVANNDSRLSDARTPTSHSHGQITNDGKNDSTAVTMASADDILITDYSDSNKVKRTEYITTGHIKDSTAHSNIGTSANATQSTINSNIDTALGNINNLIGSAITYIVGSGS